MGLKWFRAQLSMKKEATKVPEMMGLYRRISFFESAIQKNTEVSAKPFSITNDSMTSDDNGTVQCDRSKTDITNQSSSSIISEDIMVKRNDKKPQINNHAVENTESSTAIKYPSVKKKSICEDSSKISKDQDNMSDAKSPIYSDNELVI